MDLRKTDIMPFEGIEAVETITPSSTNEKYTVVYDTNTKAFVFKVSNFTSVPTYYLSSPVVNLYNDTSENPFTVRKDVLFSDGKYIYAYDKATGGLVIQYKADEVPIEILSSDVYGEVYKKSEYLASKRTGEDARIYEMARVTKYSNELLDSFFNEAAETADLHLKDFVGTYKGSIGLTYRRLFRQPSRYDASLWELAEKSLQSFFVHFVLAQWLNTCGMPEADKYQELAAGDIEDVLIKMCYKEQPKHHDVPEGTSTETKGKVAEASNAKPKKKYIKG